MHTQLELKNVIIAQQGAMGDLLWNKIHDLFRYLHDIADLSTEGDVLEYLHNISREEPAYGQEITVHNRDIDPVLKRYMLEAAMLGIPVTFDVAPLEQLSTESAFALTALLERCFANIFDYRSGLGAFLSIQSETDGVLIYAEKAQIRVFEERLPLF